LSDRIYVVNRPGELKTLRKFDGGEIVKSGH
jgi:hypothetical protein